MKIRQNVRHWAAKKALTTPVVGDVASDRLVDLHTSIFLNKADEDRREERRDHLDDFFDATIDTYVAALEAGFREAAAREITHVQANFDFFHPRLDGDDGDPGRRTGDTLSPVRGVFPRPRDHGRRSPRRVPAGRRRRTCAVDPGAACGVAYENAVAGFADDVYVETGDGETVVGGDIEEPEDVDPATAPGLDEDEASV